MLLEGKGIYIWKLHRIANGNVQVMVDKAREAGLTHVIIKIADGANAYNVDLARPATDAFKAAGILVWGWAWLWLREPFEEAEIAAHRSQALGLDGFMVNAEYPAKGKTREVLTYMETLRSLLPDLPLGLSSYRYPQFHRNFPWHEFLSMCDLNSPQMYWVGEEPADCVRHSLARHHEFPFSLPIIPTGAAFGEQYGSTFFRASPDEIVEFLDAIRANDLPAANFWSWDWTETNGPDLWDAIASYDWPASVEWGPPQDIAMRFWNALTSVDLESLATLYHDNAVHVTAQNTVQGPTAIKAKYAQLLNSLPGLRFQLDSREIENNIRFLRWRATSEGTRIIDGLDTIGIRAGKIQYHSSSYRLVTE